MRSCGKEIDCNDEYACRAPQYDVQAYLYGVWKATHAADIDESHGVGVRSMYRGHAASSSVSKSS